VFKRACDSLRSKASRLRSGLTLLLLPASKRNKRQCVSSASIPLAAQPGAKVPVEAHAPPGAAGSTRAAPRKQAAELKGKGKLVMENTSDGNGHIEDKTKTRVVDRTWEKNEKEGDTRPQRDMDSAGRRAAAPAPEGFANDGGGAAGSAAVPPGSASSALLKACCASWGPAWTTSCCRARRP